MLACVALAVTSCSAETERETILPWLMTKSTTRQWGGFGSSTSKRLYARYWGFWRSLDAWDASVLDPGHALVRDAEGAAILREGSLTPTRVCGLHATLTIPPVAGAVDCAESSIHTGLGLVRIRATRLGLDGEVRDEWTFTAVGERRVFHGPARVLAYGADGTPHFLTMDAEAARDHRHRPIACALLAPRRDGEPRVIEGPAAMTWDQCMQPTAWAGIAEETLLAPRWQ